VEIIFHAHHATFSPRLRRRAELAVELAATRLGRAVDAVVRFEQDGPVKRVEIVLHAPRKRDIVARGEARFYGPAMTVALDKLSAQVRKLRDLKSSARKRGATSSRKAAGGNRKVMGVQG
jgi:ribosome-associated translation inhibitor RaiA